MVGVHLRRLERLFAQYRSKAEGSLKLHFFESSQRAAGEIFRKGLTKSRRPSGLNVFSGHISEGWRGFSQGIDPKPKAVWSCTFSGYRSGSLGGALRSVWKGSRRQSGMNIFSRYISKRWRGFLQGIDQKPKAVWREYFFGVHFRTLARLFAEN